MNQLQGHWDGANFHQRCQIFRFVRQVAALFGGRFPYLAMVKKGPVIWRVRKQLNTMNDFFVVFAR